MPGYCVAGTVGAKVLAGEKQIEIDRFKTIEVNMQIKNLSFSAHADAKGIMSLIEMAKAKNVMLVHGEKLKMASLKERIEKELGVPTFDPANGETICIYPKPPLPVSVSKNHIDKLFEVELMNSSNQNPINFVPISGCIVVKEDQSQKTGKQRLVFIPEDQASKQFKSFSSLKDTVYKDLVYHVNGMLLNYKKNFQERKKSLLDAAFIVIKKDIYSNSLLEDDMIKARNIVVSVRDDCSFNIRYPSKFEEEAHQFLGSLRGIDLSVLH
jgi:hypothetical protein